MTLVDEKKQKLIIDKIINSNPFIQSGGSVINSIYTLSQLGGLGYASFLVSDDKFGKVYLNDLKESGVKMAEKKYTVGPGMTGSCLVLTTPDAERTMNTCLSISSEFSIKNINLNDLKYAKYLYIEGYLVTSEKAMTAVDEVIDFSKEMPFFYGLFTIMFAIILGVGAAFIRRFISNLRKKLLIKS